MNEWHSMAIEDVMKKLETTTKGLSEDEAERRLRIYGLNELKKEKKRTRLNIFLNQFKSILIIVLLIATALAVAVGELLDASLIVGIVFASAILGTFQEYRAEKALEALKKLTAPEAIVLRDGVEKRVKTSKIVPGDILILDAGDKIPADARVIEAHSLKVDESSLTGESVPVVKTVDPLPKDTSLPDRRNMVYAGTVVIYGKGRGVVVATGMNTEMGRIATLIQEVEKEKTPLEKKMGDVGKLLAYLCVGVAALVSVIGLLIWHYDILTMVIWAISLAVAAVPEALPAIVTGALAIGMYKMAKRNAIVKRLPAVETLGATSIICSDKTGTITKGEMTVRKIYAGKLIDVTGSGYEPKGSLLIDRKPIENPLENEELRLLILGGTLCNDARLVKEDGRWIIRGDPTEGALKVLARKAGISERDELNYPRIGEIPFSSERKRMTTVHKMDGASIAFMKGAPEVILSRCSKIMIDGTIKDLTREDVKRIMEINDEMALNALRNLAIAYKVFDETPVDIDESFEDNFIFLGIVGMMDPPRPEVRDALKLCKKAGVKVVMITGDHKLTALAIARELGIYRDGDIILTGRELEKLSDEEFERIVERVTVYARVSPQHKLKIINALKKKGYIIAMTGDGVNDAPALKAADIGVAMGITGTEVAKEASDMVLADDNFATIVSAIKEGRTIYDDIKKYLLYLLGCNISEILIPLFASFAALPLPFFAIHYLWINLVTDGFPAMALGIDPAEPDIMERPPRKLKEGIFSKNETITYLAFTPIVTSIVIIFSFFNRLSAESVVEARTEIFTLMIVIELLIALSCRSLRYSVFRVGIFKNKYLILAIVGSLLIQFTILYIPVFHQAFKITYPSIQDWLIAIPQALAVFASIEILKELLSRRMKLRRNAII